ncbi:MAG TPA: complex I subunit 5 family protein [Lachnospiraceae bacterium]|nr:complex I subunit 5 family protein [Lachnospiraceae bacterium]
MLAVWIVFAPFAAAFAVYGIGKKSETARDFTAIGFTFAELCLSAALLFSMPSFTIRGIFIGGLAFTTDGFRAVYSIVTSVMWAGTTLFSEEYFKEEREGLNGYLFFVLITLGATQGVMLSADLMTAFIFFEILSFTSFTWVIHEENEAAIRAAKTYLAIAVIGGLLLFMGLLLLWHAAGTLEFSELKASAAGASDQKEVFAAGVLILFGFGAKAGMFPLHIWLPKAHPVAPAPASALLSGILTKVGVYGILMTTVQAFAGNTVYGILVLVLGTVTMALGALLAVFSVNLKRTLACSSMSQIGFILTGIGMYVLLLSGGENEAAALSLSGAVLHMVNHSLLKLVLFLSAGAVAMNLHALNLNDIRGYGRNKPFLKTAFALGALGISGVPFFNGYISKTLLHEGITAGAELYPAFGAALRGIEWIFLISGGLTFAYMLKLFIAIFVEKNPTRQAEFDADRKCMNKASTAAVVLPSFFMVILGQPFITNRLAAFMTGSGTASGADIAGGLLTGTGNTAGGLLAGIGNTAGGASAVMSAILDFRPFTLTNLSGSLISLAIGAVIYIFFVRRVLISAGDGVRESGKAEFSREDTRENGIRGHRRDDAPRSARYSRNGAGYASNGTYYVDRWPVWLDLENAVYRPLLLRFLPFVLGHIAAVFGENKILTPLAKGAVRAYKWLAAVFGENKILTPLAKGAMASYKWLARLFGENKILIPLSKAAVFFGAFTGRVFATSTDALIAALRATVLRERKPAGVEPLRMSRFRAFREETAEAARPVVQNFSFSLFMTCIGILVILAVLLFILL